MHVSGTRTHLAGMASHWRRAGHSLQTLHMAFPKALRSALRLSEDLRPELCGADSSRPKCESLILSWSSKSWRHGSARSRVGDIFNVGRSQCGQRDGWWQSGADVSEAADKEAVYGPPSPRHASGFTFRCLWCIHAPGEIANPESVSKLGTGANDGTHSGHQPSAERTGRHRRWTLV